MSRMPARVPMIVRNRSNWRLRKIELSTVVLRRRRSWVGKGIDDRCFWLSASDGLRSELASEWRRQRRRRPLGRASVAAMLGAFVTRSVLLNWMVLLKRRPYRRGRAMRCYMRLGLKLRLRF